MRTGRLLLIIGLVIVLIAAAVAAYMFLLGGGDGPASPEPLEQEPTTVPQEEIVVAAQDLPRGLMITEGSGAVVTTTWPREAVSDQAITNVQRLYGQVTRQAIARGTPIMEGMMGDVSGELGAVGSDAALQIPAGRVGYALPVSRYSSVAWALQPGDHVDVIISLLMVDLDEVFQSELPNQFTCVTDDEACQDGTFGRLEALPNGWVVHVVPGDIQRPRLVTQLTVQDATVLRIGDWDRRVHQVMETPPPEAEGEEEEATPEPRESVRPVTLALRPQDASVLKYAEESGASIDLVLRSAADAGKEVVTEPVTLRYLLDRFNIALPSKLPYGIQPSVESLQPGAAGPSQPLGVEGGRVPSFQGGTESGEPE